jgi:multisubunit Na+/H+ antiporter MnhG subunit
MNAGGFVADVLLGIGVALELLACLGIVAMGTDHARLHYLAPAALGSVPIAVAIWVDSGPSTIALQATLLAAFLLVASPALTHATARAARIAARGDWRSAPGRARGGDGR